jgi:histidinol-phosphate aminotransferase
LVEALTRVKDSFNSYPLGRLAQAGAIASLEDEAHFQQARSAVMRNRSDLTSALIRLGLDVLPSSANFVFARHLGHSGRALATALRERAVLVRHFAAPRISDFLRITIGSESDLGRLTEALSEILAETR